MASRTICVWHAILKRESSHKRVFSEKPHKPPNSGVPKASYKSFECDQIFLLDLQIGIHLDQLGFKLKDILAWAKLLGELKGVKQGEERLLKIRTFVIKTNNE